MSDPESTQPNPNVAKAEAAARSIWAWGMAHTVASAIIGGLLVGWILGKLL